MTKIPSLLCPPPAEDKFSHITTEKIELERVLNLFHHPAAGGKVFFSGEVRNLNQGKEVTHLYYESEPAMAEICLKEITNEAIKKFGLLYAFCIHRVGQVNVGECAVVVCTAHAHRKEAYQANEYIIDRVKHEVPIWKNEYYSDGSNQWGGNCNCH